MKRLASFALALATLCTFASALQAQPTLTLDGLRRIGILPPKPTIFARPDSGPRAGFAVGEERELWTYDLSVMPPKNVSIPSTCRGVGETVAVFVADSEWSSAVSQSDIDAIIASFDVDTPNQNGVGIMAANIELFGAMSDVDGEPRLMVFIYEIPGYQGQAFDGFFRAEDLAPFQPGCESNPMAYCSNEAEMIHVNSSNAGSEYMIGVMAHEFQHLIHHNHDQNEESWISEAMSELAMSASGYEDAGHLNAYLTNHADPLVTAEFVHYGAVMLWGTFLYESFGADFIRALVKAPQNGIEGLSAAWQASGLDTNFTDAFADWALWNALDGYDLLDLPAVNADGAVPALVDGYASGAVSIPAYSYLWLNGPVVGGGAHDDLIVRFEDATDATLRVAGFNGDTLIEATPAQAGGWRIPASVGELVLALGNPKGSVANVTVGFELDTPEAPDTTTPEAEVVEVVEDLSGETETVPAGDTSADSDVPDDEVSDYCLTHCCDYSCEEDDSDDASGCTMTNKPAGAAPYLLLLALALLALRRRSTLV